METMAFHPLSVQ